MELADTYSNGHSTHFSALQNSRKLSMDTTLMTN